MHKLVGRVSLYWNGGFKWRLVCCNEYSDLLKSDFVSVSSSLFVGLNLLNYNLRKIVLAASQ